ncbi:MAG: glycosyltransferase family 39 protein [Parcubacteria group bacterium]
MATNIVWIIQDQSPPLWDMAGHSYRSVYDSELVLSGQLETLLISQETHYPFFTYLVTGVFYLFFGHLVDVPQYSLLLFLVIAQLATFAITKIFTGSDKAAFFASILLALFPLTAHFSRTYDLDYPLMAMFGLSFFCLLKTKFFSETKWSLLFGLAVGLAFLTKFMLPAFIAPLILVYLAYYFIGRKKKDYPLLKTVLRNGALAFLIFVLIAGPWYYFHYETVLAVGEETNANEFFVKFTKLISWSNFTYYFKTISAGLSWPQMIIFLAAVITLAIRRDRKFIFLFSVLTLSYLFLTFYLYAKESRFFLPLYPLLALIIAMFVFRFKNKYLRWGAATVSLLIAGVFWLQTSWAVPIVRTDFQAWPAAMQVYGLREVTEKDPQYGFTYPTQYHTQLSQLVAEIVEDKSDPEAVSMIAVVPNSIFLTANQVQYQGGLKGLKANYQLSRQLKVHDWRQSLLAADYVITKTGDQGPLAWALQAYEVAAEEADELGSFFSDNFTIVHEYSYQGIGDEEKVRLYRRK